MTLETLRDFLLYCTLINYLMVSIWFFAYYVAHDRLYRLHQRWFSISPERWDAIHYSGMAVYKILIMLFNLAPYLALLILTGK